MYRDNLWVCIVVAALLITVHRTAATANGDSQPLAVGQRWVYEHQGPRPGSMEPNSIDGQKILHVISRFEEDGAERWVVEERYTNDPNVIGRLFVDPNRMLVGFDLENNLGEVGRFMYDPAIPYQVPALEVGAETAVETTLRMNASDVTFPTTITIQRLPDETIETPAGLFADCQSYKMTAVSTFDIKIAKVRLTEERQRWYHRQANGLVKEVYYKAPLKFLGREFKPGYTATSTLTAFEMRAVEAQQTFDPNDPRVAPSDKGNTHSSKGMAFWKTFRWLVLLAIIVVIVRRIRLPRKHANT